MRGYYQRRLAYVGTILLFITYTGAIGLLVLSCSGCAIGDRFNDGVGRDYHLHIYEPFDNARDWGPNYLVGLSGRYFANEARADVGRSTLIDKTVAQSGAMPLKPTQPLAALPFQTLLALPIR